MRAHDNIDDSTMKRATKAHMVMPVPLIKNNPHYSVSVSDNVADRVARL